MRHSTSYDSENGTFAFLTNRLKRARDVSHFPRNLPPRAMLYDPRMRGLGRGSHKKVKRQGQDIFAAADMKSYNDESTDSWEPPGDQMINEDGAWRTEANGLSDGPWSGGMQTRASSATPSSISSDPLGSCSSGAVEQGYGSSEASRTDGACGTSSLQTDGAFQTAMAEIPSSSSSTSLLTPAGGEQANDSTDTTPSATSDGHNTWITATSQEALSSGVTIVPFITLRKTTATSSTSGSPSMTISTSSSSDAHSSSAPSIVAQIDGVSPSDKAGTVAGITVGAAVLVLLIVVAVLAYVRGGRMRGLSSDAHPRKLRSARLGPSLPQGREGEIQGQETTEAPVDVEQGSTATGSKSAEEKEHMEDVDLRGVKRSNTKGDDVRWLEAWCRDKDKMMAQPPELRFNPALPLPPIILEGTEKDGRPVVSS